MRNFLLKHWLKIVGIAAGSLGGYIYYYYVGCVSGTCPITSNPYRMTLYGALLGYLLFSMFSDVKVQKKTVENNLKNFDNTDKNK